MSRKTANAPIEPHTEYTHVRIRCPRCGTSVPRTGDRPDGSLCVRCEGAE